VNETAQHEAPTPAALLTILIFPGTIKHPRLSRTIEHEKTLPAIHTAQDRLSRPNERSS